MLRVWRRRNAGPYRFSKIRGVLNSWQFSYKKTIYRWHCTSDTGGEQLSGGRCRAIASNFWKRSTGQGNRALSLRIHPRSIQRPQSRGVLLLKLALLANTQKSALISTNEFFGPDLDQGGFTAASGKDQLS